MRTLGESGTVSSSVMIFRDNKIALLADEFHENMIEEFGAMIVVFDGVCDS